MNPIDFFEAQVERYNEENKCGLCWNFAAPLFESAINIQDIPEDKKCCIQLFLINLRESTINTYDPNTNFITRKTCDYSFVLYVLIQSNMGLNNYTEKQGYSVQQSKWETIYKPLMDCMGCDAQLEFCEITGYPIQVTNWQMDMVNNYLDQQYAGYRITATFRETT